MSDFERDAVLLSGRSVHITLATPDDFARVRRFYERLSDTSTYYRFFGIRRALPDSELLATVDPSVAGHVTLLATIADEPPCDRDAELAGIGEMIDEIGPGAPAEAEVAFAVADEHHHEGIATLLLESFVGIGRRRGLAALTAVTLPGNADMLLVFRTLGLPLKTTFGDDGVTHVRIDLRAPNELASKTAARQLASEQARVRSGRQVSRG